MSQVLVLAGGPDRERRVSLDSAAAIARALRDGGHEVHQATIDRATLREIQALPGDVVWPALHGRWGEGGPLQDILEKDGRPYVGSQPGPARGAMDKVFSKSLASECGMRVLPTVIIDPDDPAPPIDLPIVVKPIFEGSTIGLHICHDTAAWDRARSEVKESGVIYMGEHFAPGREITVGVADLGKGLEALPIIEITPGDGLYDYAAKYERDDTTYTLEPRLPGAVSDEVRRGTLALCARLGVRHVARADFILTPDGHAVFLEINTMPGFTSHSLVPKAAAHMGVTMSELASSIVSAAAARVHAG
jgi:D-alanine-D-alanine ligase